MNMKKARKLYREEYGTPTPCPRCTGKEEKEKLRARIGCCATGTVISYPSSAPGFRAFAKMRWAPDGRCSGKLATVIQ